MLRENSTPNFLKKDYFLFPDTHVHVEKCTFIFWKIWCVLFSCNTRYALLWGIFRFFTRKILSVNIGLPVSRSFWWQVRFKTVRCRSCINMHANLNMSRVVLSSVTYPSLFYRIRIPKSYARNCDFSTIEEQYSFRNYTYEAALTWSTFFQVEIFFSKQKSSFCKPGQEKDLNFFRVPNQALL